MEKALTHESVATHERRKRKERLPVAAETDVGTPVERVDCNGHHRHQSTDPDGRWKKNKKNKTINFLALR